MTTILIVEDHQDYRQAVCRFLKASKVKASFIEASSGEEAIELAKEKKPHLVLMDFNLGGMNGLEAAERIKSRLPDCSIIIMSMFDIKEVQALSTKNMIKNFISKADIWDQLVPSISRIMHSLGLRGGV